MGGRRSPVAGSDTANSSYSVDHLDLPSFVVADLRQRLLDWYGQTGRSLPWRETRDPYAIWISEIMLQQTQVKTVLPYYERWLAVFPTVEALAIAPQEQVLKLWQGLGYYARARNLHKAAQVIHTQHNGQFPKNLEAALALPGIGQSTAGGILSAAFNQPVSILDGNVKRVLTRLLALERPPNRVLRLLWQCSDQLLDPVHPRDFNQALMDLGATVCTPRQPSCGSCPWAMHCRAYERAMQNELPVREEKAPVPHKAIGVAVIWDADGQILIDRRRQEGLLGGLWEFPGGKIEPGETIQDCIRREIREELGIEVVVGDSLITIDHAYSHFRVTLNVHHCHYLSGEPQPLECDEVRWVRPEDLEQYPFPAANVQIIEAIHQNPRPDFSDHLTEEKWGGSED
ncbi:MULTISPECIES: A/G-specific adenine glycosylase [unclassified Leptolyngbya]|uniref:A/G-specific adenine glycosylase n=1 Tax=unclassified Leptolyngbya TaxID=2650499 RepID=UPI0016856D3E|nr:MULTISPECIES: A/G-specific adenine glycosylase [unclassified Leptolyngbya]MBD1913289.1 A/G-specific adenine glycosylase [Leptolyngbya sp. FACHB-8]MBD2154378.1 A/G-specific adenine glycosylase [Leptolyngbya sp. FACHB-16]